MAQVVASRSRKQHDDPRPPAGRAKYLAPAFRGVRASELLTTIDNPPVPWSREAWAPLGIFTRDGRPDAPYKREATCAATAERADLATFGPVVAESQERLRPGKVAKSNPVSAACMARIEPLNPNVPLKVADACAQNQRRFPQGDAGRKEHAGLVDHGETERRANRDVKFLARECKAEFGLEPSSANTNDVARRRRPRKVFIDLGARSYYSSCKWFRDHYPGGRDFELHGFDVASKWGYSFQFDKAATFHSAAVWNDTGYVSFTLKHDTFGGRFHRNLFDAPHDLGRLVTVPAVALADALRMLVTRDDFVVVKMDVEGTEWMLLRHMAETGAFDLVDEILIECHNAEYVPGWPTRHSLADCHRMFNSLRAAGVYAHEWY